MSLQIFICYASPTIPPHNASPRFTTWTCPPTPLFLSFYPITFSFRDFRLTLPVPPPFLLLTYRAFFALKLSLSLPDSLSVLYFPSPLFPSPASIHLGPGSGLGPVQSVARASAQPVTSPLRVSTRYCCFVHNSIFNISFFLASRCFVGCWSWRRLRRVQRNFGRLSGLHIVETRDQDESDRLISRGTST